MSGPTVTIEALDLKWLIERANGHPNPTRESDRRLDDLGLALAVPAIAAEPGDPLYRVPDEDTAPIYEVAQWHSDSYAMGYEDGYQVGLVDGRGVIPAVAPVPPDGIAGVLDADLMDDRDPIHGEFGLTYGNYLVWHRSLMQAMPVEWQRRMAQCIRDYWRVFDSDKVPQEFEVRIRGERGHYQHDPFSSYRHIATALVDSVRVTQALAKADGA